MIKIDLKLFAIVLFCTVTLINCVKEEERKPFDKYIFKSDQEKEVILKKCYSIIVKWREGYTLNDNLSKIMNKDHSQWSIFDKMDLLRYNKEFNEVFVKERCDEVFPSHLKPFDIEEDSETNSQKASEESEHPEKKFFWDESPDKELFEPVEDISLPKISKSKGESEIKELKEAALEQARFVKMSVGIVGGQLIVTPTCYAFTKIPQVVTRPLWGVIRAKIFKHKISEEVAREVKKIPKSYFKGLSDCVKKGPAFKVYKKRKLLKKKREKQERKDRMNQFL